VSRNLTSTELKRLHRSWRDRSTGRLALLLDGVQTPFNVGSIIRTAAAFRIDHVWLVPPTAPPNDVKTQKTAMGTQRYLTFTESPTIAEAAVDVAAAGYRLIGVELADTAVPLHEIDLAGDVCLALGHEDRGLSKGALDVCAAIGFVPLVGKVGSLNVATAAAMSMYEARRQGWVG
jgi:tRNA (guanosine-2'-O-)-methyltransferase